MSEVLKLINESRFEINDGYRFQGAFCTKSKLKSSIIANAGVAGFLQNRDQADFCRRKFSTTIISSTLD